MIEVCVLRTCGIEVRLDSRRRLGTRQSRIECNMPLGRSELVLSAVRFRSYVKCGLHVACLQVEGLFGFVLLPTCGDRSWSSAESIQHSRSTHIVQCIARVCLYYNACACDGTCTRIKPFEAQRFCSVKDRSVPSWASFTSPPWSCTPSLDSLVLFVFPLPPWEGGID